MNSLRTPLSKVRGNGSAGTGLSHYIAHRISAIILALSFPFFMHGLITSLPLGYEGLRAWLSCPYGVFTWLTFISAGLFHARLGMNEVILDYIHAPFGRNLLLFLNFAVCCAFWVMAIMAILKMWITGDATSMDMGA